MGGRFEDATVDVGTVDSPYPYDASVWSSEAATGDVGGAIADQSILLAKQITKIVQSEIAVSGDSTNLVNQVIAQGQIDISLAATASPKVSQVLTSSSQSRLNIADGLTAVSFSSLFVPQQIAAGQKIKIVDALIRAGVAQQEGKPDVAISDMAQARSIAHTYDATLPALKQGITQRFSTSSKFVPSFGGVSNSTSTPFLDFANQVAAQYHVKGWNVVPITTQ